MTALTAAAQLGGTERVLLDLATHAFEYGLVLRVLSPRQGPLVDVLNRLGVETEVVEAPAAMLRASQRPGHWHTIPPALVGIGRWARALAAHPFCREAQVVYSVAFKSHLAATVSRLRPVVWHLHEFPPARSGAVWRWMARRMPRALIANSEAVARAWEQGAGSGERRAGGRPSRRPADPPITVVPNGVELDRFTPRPATCWIHSALGLEPQTRLIGMPAVFARWKGQLEVIEAFSAVVEEFPTVHLVFVGGSIYDTVAERRFGAELDERIAAAGDRIHLLPFQPAIERAYPEFDLVVHYSTRAEPFGRVVLEAMACGIPVVAAAEGGPIEIMGSGSTASGWLVQPRNPEALARVLREALSTPQDHLRTMGAVGRQTAEDRYSAREFARRVAAVLGSASAG